MEQLDLNQIRNFVRLVQAGSFTKASEALHQPKSRISRRLAALEQELGVQLVYRTTRQFQLTETGKVYYERCRGLIEGLESLATELSESTSEVSGLIRITASDDMGVNHLPAILEEFTKLHPGVRFDILLTQAYVDLVKESIDIGFRFGHLKDSSLKAKRIGLLKNIFVASPGFVERYRPDDEAKISSLPFLGMRTNSKIEVYKGSDSKKISLKMNPIFIVNNPAMLANMVLMGRGFSYLPEFLCKDLIAEGKLVHIYKNLHGEKIPISVVTPDQKEIPLRVKKFSEFAASKLKYLFE